jgi:hypothetical protein
MKHNDYYEIRTQNHLKQNNNQCFSLLKGFGMI